MSTNYNASSSGSLTQAFKKANHIRHNIMDASMLLMAISAAVLAAGPMVAVFDPITPFIKMHFDGFLTAINTLPDFISSAWSNMGNDVWLSGIDINSHAMNAAVTSHGSGALLGFDQWLGGLAPDEIANIQGDLKEIYGGMSMRQYYNFNFTHGLH